LSAYVESEGITPTPAPSVVATPVVVVGPGVTLEQAIKHIIASNAANRLLSARTDDIEGRKVHVIKTLSPDGRIEQQTVSAETGAVLDSGDE
jgi:uncharacterized membrane protein YkoI